MEISLSHDIHDHSDDSHNHNPYDDDDVRENQDPDQNFFENLKLEGDDDEEDYTKKVDQYFEMLKQACDTLSQIDGGYKGKLEAYIKKRYQESELYREVATTPIGGDCDLKEIHEKTNERRWKASTKVKGPAWVRYLERNPPTKIRGLTDRELATVNKNFKDRALWGKIM